MARKSDHMRQARCVTLEGQNRAISAEQQPSSGKYSQCRNDALTLLTTVADETVDPDNVACICSILPRSLLSFSSGPTEYQQNNLLDAVGLLKHSSAPAADGRYPLHNSLHGTPLFPRLGGGTTVPWAVVTGVR